MESALEYRKTLPEGKGLIKTEANADRENRLISLAPPADLEVRLAYLPKEVLPENRYFKLTDNNDRVQLPFGTPHSIRTRPGRSCSFSGSFTP